MASRTSDEIYYVLIARDHVVGHNYVRRFESGGLLTVYDRNEEVCETRERRECNLSFSDQCEART